jgi:predicted small lipoprotein YifL
MEETKMKRNRKVLTVLLAVLLISSFTAGCGKKAGTNTGTTP